MLQAVILAAGRSTRTYPLTVTRPKPLLPLLNRPLLHYQLDQLAGWVDEVILVVGYRKELIERRFAKRFGPLSLTYVEQQEQRGTADALRAAAPRVRDRCLVLNGDDLYHRRDLQALVQQSTAILVCRVRDPQNRGVVTVRGDRIIEIVEKPTSPPPDALASVGAYAFSAEDLAPLGQVRPSRRGELELPDLVQALARQGRVGFHRVQSLWFPLTYAWDVLSATFFLLESPERAHEMSIELRSVEELRRRADLALAPDARLQGPLVLGSGVVVGDRCHLKGPAVLGEGCVVQAGAVVDRSVLFPSTRVETGAHVSHSVLGEGTVIGSGAQTRVEADDGGDVAVRLHSNLVAAGMKRLGLIAGDQSVVESDASTPPGTLLSPGTTYPRGR